MLSLRDVLSISMAENPDLVTIRGTENVGAAAVEVAGVYPWNPFVQAQYLPNGHPFIPGSPGNAIGQSNYYVWAMQRFELAHQRQFREGSAAAALGQIRWNIQQAELLTVAQTERLYFAALYQRQLRDLAADTESLSTRLNDIAERHFKAGLATSMQKINAQIALRQTASVNESWPTPLIRRRCWRLRQQLGWSPDRPLDLAGDLTQYEWLSAADAAVQNLGRAVRIGGNAGLSHGRRTTRCDGPAVADGHGPGEPEPRASGPRPGRPSRSHLQHGRRRDAVPRLATAARLRGVQQWLRLGAAASHGGAAATPGVRAAQRRATNEAAAAIDRYERARGLAKSAGKEATQNPPPELEQVLAQFEAGNAQIVDLLAVQNNLLQEARSYLDLLNEVAQSAAVVTQTAAIPPERLFAPRPPTYPHPPRS